MIAFHFYSQLLLQSKSYINCESTILFFTFYTTPKVTFFMSQFGVIFLTKKYLDNKS